MAGGWGAIPPPTWQSTWAARPRRAAPVGENRQGQLLPCLSLPAGPRRIHLCPAGGGWPRLTHSQPSSCRAPPGSKGAGQSERSGPAGPKLQRLQPRALCPPRPWGNSEQPRPCPDGLRLPAAGGHLGCVEAALGSCSEQTPRFSPAQSPCPSPHVPGAPGLCAWGSSSPARVTGGQVPGKPSLLPASHSRGLPLGPVPAWSRAGDGFAQQSTTRSGGNGSTSPCCCQGKRPPPGHIRSQEQPQVGGGGGVVPWAPRPPSCFPQPRCPRCAPSSCLSLHLAAHTLTRMRHSPGVPKPHPSRPRRPECRANRGAHTAPHQNKCTPNSSVHMHTPPPSRRYTHVQSHTGTHTPQPQAHVQTYVHIQTHMRAHISVQTQAHIPIQMHTHTPLIDTGTHAHANTRAHAHPSAIGTHVCTHAPSHPQAPAKPPQSP